MMVADIFTALAADRPYRKRMQKKRDYQNHEGIFQSETPGRQGSKYTFK